MLHGMHRLNFFFFSLLGKYHFSSVTEGACHSKQNHRSVTGPSFCYGAIVPFRYGIICPFQDHISVTGPYACYGTICPLRDHMSVTGPYVRYGAICPLWYYQQESGGPFVRYGETLYPLRNHLPVTGLSVGMSVTGTCTRCGSIDPIPDHRSFMGPSFFYGAIVRLRDQYGTIGPLRNYEDPRFLKGPPFGYGITTGPLIRHGTIGSLRRSSDSYGTIGSARNDLFGTGSVIHFLGPLLA